jgi:prepilin-type processing-associated H-X9-DG protein
MHESTNEDLPPKRTLNGVTGDLNFAGVFFMNSHLTPADITDGLSNTVFVSEIVVVPGEDMRGMLHYPEGPLYHHNYTPNSSVPDEIRQTRCISTKNAPCNDSLFSSWRPRELTMTARSSHSGGVNILLGDGSTRFVSDSVQLVVWQSLSTPRGGEIVKDF